MDPTTVFCPNLNCPARGKLKEGNIGVHSLQHRRYKCSICQKTFTQTTGTAFYRLRHSQELVTQVVTLLSFGCPTQAIVAAFALDEHTVASWQARAGKHCESVHNHLIAKPRDLGQVQMDELRVKLQGRVVWMALALMVSTRLWLGGVVSTSRDGAFICDLVDKVRACATALCAGILFCTDGLKAYIRAIREAFRERVVSGQAGRPRLQMWKRIFIAQSVKQYEAGRVVGIDRRSLTEHKPKLRR